ncbi:MAG: DUF3365 domain-containing protein [Planctomycetota bacterium]
MSIKNHIRAVLALGIIGLVGSGLTAESADEKVNTEKPPAATKPRDDRVTLAVARDRAKVMEDVYKTTLDVIHHRYFHGERAAVPARAMEDVFAEMKRQSKVEARWISINTKAMSINHDPKTDFELRAVKELGDEKSEIETVEDGYYRRAGVIPLTSGCLSCHEGLFKSSSKVQRYAGLVISIPIREESAKQE